VRIIFYGHIVRDTREQTPKAKVQNDLFVNRLCILKYHTIYTIVLYYTYYIRYTNYTSSSVAAMIRNL